MILTLIRSPVVRPADGEAFTPGILYASGLPLGHTCEDEDRFLETVGIQEKCYGRTAIPRGRYLVEVTFSNRFQKELPAILDTPGFSGIRVHGGNRAEDSLGCILLGKIPTATGVAQCAPVVARLIAMISACEARLEKCYLEVK